MGSRKKVSEELETFLGKVEENPRLLTSATEGYTNLRRRAAEEIIRLRALGKELKELFKTTSRPKRRAS